MREWCSLVFEWLSRNLADVVFVSAIIGLAVGFWMAWEPLGLIVPSIVVVIITVVARLIPQDRPPETKEKDDDA